jgi:ectoine hydroxylase-related dioxygenase (phytanoyl-CoA dioxygenase family)
LSAVELLASTDRVDDGKRNLDRYGYTIHDGLIGGAELAALRARLEEQVELECEEGVASYRLANETGLGERRLGRPPDGTMPAWQAVTALPNKGRVFIDLAMHPVVAEYSRHVFGGVSYYLAQSIGMIVRKGSGGQLLHTDQFAVPFDTPLPVYFHVMIALTDFEGGVGVTEVVPGSHRWPRPRYAENPATKKMEPIETGEMVSMVCRAGSAIVFDGRLWHHQGRSTSERLRLSILNGYCMHFIRSHDDYAASLHDEVYERLTDDERAMLGFELTSDFGGRLYPRYPHERRYNTNVRYPYIPELRRGGRLHGDPFEDMGAVAAKADLGRGR